MKKNKISEAKDVVLYKILLRVLGDFVDSFPATGVEKLFHAAVDSGVKIMPKDKHALEILGNILSFNTPPTAVQKLLNIRFSDLDANVKPLHRDGRRHLVAFWNRDNVAHDRIKELIDFAGTGKAGSWSDMNGDSVKLIDTSITEKEE